MTYKDPDKQREAQRDWVRQKRAAKGSTEQGSTGEPITTEKQSLSSIAKAAKTWRPCKYCGKHLDYAVLECCNDCAEMRSKSVSPAQDGHILASRPVLEFTGKMTDFERERYKPASKLKPGRYNPVSNPGDSHYGQA